MQRITRSAIPVRTLDKFVIEGGHSLRGEIPVGGSKNTALPLMSAALLAGGTTTLHNIPVLHPMIGEPVSLKNPSANNEWWKLLN